MHPEFDFRNTPNWSRIAKNNNDVKFWRHDITVQLS